jgi:quercetin dioxygenase-like cupin family protein
LVRTYLKKTVNSIYIEAGTFACDPGKSLEEHIHEEGDEYCMMLSGQGIFDIEGVKTVLNEGEVICIPKGAQHYSYNTGNEPFISAYLICP